MQEDLGDEGMAVGVDTIARHTFTKERQSQAMSELSYHQHYQPFSTAFKAKAEEQLVEEQAGFRPGQSTVE